MVADRVTVTDENEGRLPREFGSTLRPQKVEMLREWMDRGAAYAPHRPFIPRRCPTLPEVKNQGEATISDLKGLWLFSVSAT